MSAPRKSAPKRSRKPAATPTAPAPRPTVLVMRTCAADMTAHGGFRWPESGPVECSDWSEVAECGRGLHGLLWGMGDVSLLSTATDARWLAVEVPADETVDLAGKIKFRRGVVVCCGTRDEVAAYIVARAPAGVAVAFSTATAGDGGTATAGYMGTATAGDGGTATAGYGGTATAGYRGTATAGYRGTATAGDGGELRIRWYDGDRYRTAVFYVGEDVEAGVPYRCEGGRAVRADGSAK